MTDPATLSMDELDEELATWASHLTAGMCRWLDLVAEVHRRGIGVDVCGGTCAGWLAWRCGLAPRAAREHLRVARRLRELPVIHATFARGQLSYAKVRALTRVAEPETERELIELASVLTAAELERALRAYRRVTAAEAAELHEQAYVNVWWDDDGSLQIRGRLAPEDGAVVAEALEAVRARLREEARGSAEPPRLTDALVALAGGRSEQVQVVVHVDADALASDHGACVVEDGPALAPETARRLACDSAVVRIRERSGRTLSVGRKTRAVPTPLRRALQARDRTCRFPGCENRRFVHAHHIRHWARGGETSVQNLVLLCTRHHRLVHEGGYTVDEKLCFYDPRGRRIPCVHAPPRGRAAALLQATATRLPP